ncbi:NADPH-dependent FMN reductase [Pseudomonas mediterranea]|uniref:NADPH-dependent FMN reductase n=1 Tax=Pseudomonas mediterranea TaxID=183795 RepID=UPI00223442A8|nr:NADPH-dependent FMN reductase [Pseudomonas mediterranea]UZD98617.1 NAD(P)H-dependent oxidoreductase [Pseudomonas mediterranea]
MTTVSVIVGSTRDSRFSSAPANWIKHHLEQREGLDVRLLDLRDFDLPFFDSAMLPGFPGRPAYENENVRRWTEQIATSDAFVVATAEYNFGPPAVLKNALDWVYPEWNRKPVSFVSWGSVGGARAVQQLREIATELQMATIRTAVHIPVGAIYAHFQGKTDEIEAALQAQDDQAGRMIDDLLWWSHALKNARTATV